MKHKLFVVLAVLLLIPVLLAPAPLKAATTYQPTWASVDTHPPAPEWFKDAKFGIYFHWGVFSVPAYSNEWYPRRMYISGDSCYTYHNNTYGTPTAWPYHNFINGANNKSGVFTKFAPKLTSQGGNFDPNAWAQLFYDAGAKYAGPVAEHHDGFSMWNSTVNEWNSVGKGPQLDLASLLTTAIRNKGMKIVTALHHAYNYTGFYDHVPTQSDPSLKKLYGQLTKTQEDQLWYDKLKEVIDLYQPDIIWQDFNLSQVAEQQRLNFLAYYYNKGIDWGKEVVATYKDGFNQNGEVLDFERGGPGNLTTYYWLTDDSISSSSWCYTQGIGYYSTAAMLHSFLDRISKNGNLLLNIAPMADGTIPQGQKDILLGMGDWLGKFGESVYSTRAWECYGEGPTQMGGGSFTTPVAGTNQDIRFSRNKANNTLYAIVLGWPGDGAQLKITTLNSNRINLSTLTNVSLFGATAGTYINVSYTQDTEALKITMPSPKPYTALAYALKLTFSGQIPALQVVPKNAFSQIEAENFDSSYGSVRAETCGEGGQNLGYINTGDYVVYKSVDFGSGASSFQGRIAGLSTSGRIYLRLGSSSGTLIGTLNGVNTGGWQTYTTASCSVSGATGRQDLYMVFDAGLNLNWFKFIAQNTPTPTPTPATTPTPTPTANIGSPVAAWSFNEGSGTTAADSSGNGHTGTLTGSAGWTASGKSGGALSLNGSGYVNIANPSTIVLGNANCTIAAWIKTSSTSTMGIVTKDNNGAHITGDKLFGVNHTSTKFGVDHGWVTNLDSNKTITDGAWHHVAWTQQKDGSGSNEVWKLYVDGVFETTKTAATLADVAGHTVRIGSGSSTSYFANNFNGVIDEVKIYNRVLNDTDIAALAQ